MYLTAHHLEQPAGKSGINAFLHRHRSLAIDNFSWTEPDVSRIADEIPGSLVKERCDLFPGGKRVLSYLDIAASDSISDDRLHIALEKFETEVPSIHIGDVAKKIIDEIGIRFGLPHRPASSITEEYQRLKDRVVELLHSPSLPIAEESLNVSVAVVIDGDIERYVFSLYEESKRRVSAVLGESGPLLLPVGIDLSTKELFEELHGDILPHIIDGLTGLRTEQILELGGVTFRDAETGTLLTKWPRKTER
jgi:hypothetical protein